MRIDVVPVYGKMISSHISGSTVIVVDVLRSTSCITMAVKNGAERVIPAVDPGEAASIAGRLGIRDCVLAGERGGIKLPDFNLGNSPAEYSAENVQGNGGDQHFQRHGRHPRLFCGEGCAYRRND